MQKLWAIFNFLFLIRRCLVKGGGRLSCWSMAEIALINGHRDYIDLDFVERKRTPEPAMALGMQAHVAGLSLSNTVKLLGDMGVQRSRKAIPDWVQKANLQPESGKSPNQIVPDETVIRIND